MHSFWNKSPHKVSFFSQNSNKCFSRKFIFTKYCIIFAPLSKILKNAKCKKFAKYQRKLSNFFWKSFFYCKPYRSCFKKFVFFKWLCLKWSFFIKIIVSLTILNDNHSITIVSDDHLLKIVSDDHSLMIVNDVPLLTIVKYEPSLTIVKDSPVNDR